jgi:putative tricarboxylic transport membrane protein
MRILAVTSPKPLATIKGRTLVQQGVNLTFGNWRGLLAPADLPAADHLNMLKVIDTAHNSPSWAAMLKANSWIDEYRVGTPFTTWLKTEVASILKILKDFKLY